MLVFSSLGSFLNSGDEKEKVEYCFCVLGKKRDLVQANGYPKRLKFSLQRSVVVCNFMSAVLQVAVSVCVTVATSSSFCSYSSHLEIQREGGPYE